MDDNATASLLMKRIAVLEKSYRRLQCVVVAFGAIGALCILLAVSSGPTIVGDPQGARTEIAANGITIYDSTGKAQIFLGMGPSGRPVSKVGGIEQMGRTSP